MTADAIRGNAQRVKCPECGRIAMRVPTKYGPRDSCCGIWSWGGKPLASAETHEARKSAHAAFDPLWSGGVMSRSAAYKALSEELGVSGEHCHIAQFDAEMAGRVPMAVLRIMGKIAS